MYERIQESLQLRSKIVKVKNIFFKCNNYALLNNYFLQFHIIQDILYDFSSVCVRKCLCKLCVLIKADLQTTHLKGLPCAACIVNRFSNSEEMA